MSILASNSQVLCRNSYSYYNREDHNNINQFQFQHSSSNGNCFLWQKTSGFSWFDHKNNNFNKKLLKRDLKVESFFPDFSRPVLVEMEPINDSDQLDQILIKAQEHSEPVIIDWMATWCRKCIYLRPKLEKLAAEFDSRVKFYYVDVNKVPQALVKRGNITKMPTIQLWKDKEMKEEVIGGHKAWLVIEEVREMIKKFV